MPALKRMWVIGSPPCTALCQVNARFIIRNMSPDGVRAMLEEGRLHLTCMAHVYDIHVQSGRCVLHEHSATAASRSEPCISRLLAHPDIGGVVSHPCEYGLLAPPTDGIMRPAMKPTTWMSNSTFMLDRLKRRCQTNHAHQQLAGGSANDADNYPLGPVVKRLRGIRDTTDKRKHFDTDGIASSNRVSRSPGYVFKCERRPSTTSYTCCRWCVGGEQFPRKDLRDIPWGRRQEITLGSGFKAA